MSEENKYIIYKLFFGDHMYIGSTQKYSLRMANHKLCSKKCTKPSKLYDTIRGSGGWDAWHKEIICEVFGDKKTAREIEDKYIRELQPSCNINLAVKDYDLQKQKQREKYKLDKSYKQEYYKNNIERIKQYQYNKRKGITETPQSTH